MIKLLWNAPVSEPKMAQCIASLNLHSKQNVLDVGCGCGEVLIRVCEQYETHGTGIDSSAEHIEEAKQRLVGRATTSRVNLIEANAESFQFEPAAHHLVMCLGATHSFGPGGNAFQNSLKQMKRLAIPGGLLLVADGYMKQPATPDYRRLLGDSMPDELTHPVNVATGKKNGLIPLAAWTSSDDEWDDFEWSYQRIVEQQAVDQPNDKAIAEKLSRRREWMDAYLKWGRDTLGYGTYLFRTPRT